MEESEPYVDDTTQITEEQLNSKEQAYTDEEYTDEYEEEEVQGPVFSKPESPLLQKERKISDAQWQRLVNDPEFRYEEPAPVKESNSDSAWLRFFESLFRFLGSGAGKALIISLVSLLVLYLVFRIFRLKGNVFFAKKDKKIGVAEQDELSDNFIPDSWEKVIEDAARSGNYRLAVRHSYRYLLSLLQEREVIQYQTAKTNYQYAYELTGTKLHQPFLQLTRGYEYVWYGGFPIARDRFEAYYDQINGIKKDLL